MKVYSEYTMLGLSAGKAGMVAAVSGSDSAFMANCQKSPLAPSTQWRPESGQR
jgi:hypothetical protein